MTVVSFPCMAVCAEMDSVFNCISIFQSSRVASASSCLAPKLGVSARSRTNEATTSAHRSETCTSVVFLREVNGKQRASLSWWHLLRENPSFEKCTCECEFQQRLGFPFSLVPSVRSSGRRWQGVRRPERNRAGVRSDKGFKSEPLPLHVYARASGRLEVINALRRGGDGELLLDATMHTRATASSWQRSPVLRGAGKSPKHFFAAFVRAGLSASEETSTMLVLFLVVKVHCCKHLHSRCSELSSGARVEQRPCCWCSTH